MLFNSYTFILAFLPAALAIFHALRASGCHRASLASLVLFSLFFYGWWNPVYLLLLVPLTLANYAIAVRIERNRARRRARSRALMIAGVSLNLAVLGYFKYANFLVANLDALLGLDWVIGAIVLPLGISFFTFQKIAYIVDSYRGRVDRYDLLEFALFVSFFPQLIAGPIVHHSEILPQFRQPAPELGRCVPMGLTIFAIGLAKKVLLADHAALYATPVFDAAAAGEPLGALGAWTGALAYTVQLYFDFSGYTDMAIGAALLFGIRLPLNFASPYKAASITEFWRRWHMTLSRFLRDYLYIPLGGNRHGEPRRYANLLVTMLLGGLWHGAAWTFVLWGALHGVYLAINHLWHGWRRRTLGAPPGRAEVWAGTALTFIAVVAGWVLFRAADIGSALAILRAMAGANGLAGNAALASIPSGLFVGALLLVAWLAPNTQQFTGYTGPGIETPIAHPAQPRTLHWGPTRAWGVATGVLVAAALMNLSRVSEFLYFQF